MHLNYSQSKLRRISKTTAELLIIPAFFFLPIQAAPVNTLLVLAMLFWTLSGNLSQQLTQALKHPLSKAFVFFAFTAFISLIWTDNLEQGLHFSEKYLPYLFFPVILLLINTKFQTHYLAAFFLGIALSEILSYSMWLGITDMGKAPNDPNLWDHTAFIGHVLYSPIVAFAAYMMLSRLILGWKELKTWQRISLVLFSTTIIINLFFTHGRTGMVALLGLLFVVFLLRFPKAKFKAITLSLALTTVIPLIAYSTLDDFKQRVDIGKDDITHLFENNNAETSLGHRLISWYASIEIIKENPVLGVGIGDFAKEYEKIMSTQNVKYWSTSNPHNQYLFTFTTSGIIGLLSLVGIYLTIGYLTYQDYKTTPKNELNPIKVGLLILFLIIPLAESYLWRSNTSLLLILFSAFLFKKHFNENKI
ncbi:O-antigen ligase family protein [Thiomicrorhabdus sp. 6S2-11]|uniref:O-antigen ligase family protein n=1 Tax=Thiomicrorhabdus marina TaxID=2818442 RepID=A0ABS3Q681_9GAMM|nr:O-antigen ligase family protein [Thiomicrorhabdus marina]MBO1927648.1 O-antigen ligase family protein [Thiomicrorhabdus marina]